MKNIEKNIRSVVAKEIVCSNKEQIRNSLFSKIASEVEREEVVTNVIERAFARVTLAVSAKLAMKERLFASISEPSGWWSLLKTQVERLGMHLVAKKIYATGALMVLLTVLVLEPFSTVETVRANGHPKIATFSGTVLVERDGQFLRANNDFRLVENDVLKTGPAGFAEVILSDNSVVRLSSDTRILLSKLDVKTVNSQNQIELFMGEVWVNSVGLVGGQADLRVQSKNLVVSARSAGNVFDVRATPEAQRVVSLQDNLNLELLTEEGEIPTILRRGQVVKVKNQTEKSTYLDPLKFEERLYDFNLDWIIANYNQDKFYLATLSEDKLQNLKKLVGVTSESYFYPVKKFKNSLKLALALDPVRQLELEMHFANQKFYEAEILLAEGKKEPAKKALREYAGKLDKVVSKVQVVAAPSEKVDRLKKELSESMSVQKTSLISAIKTTEEVSVEVLEVQKQVNQVEVLVAEDDSKKGVVALMQANERLAVLSDSSLGEVEQSLDFYVEVLDGLELKESLSDEEKGLLREAWGVVDLKKGELSENDEFFSGLSMLENRLEKFAVVRDISKVKSEELVVGEMPLDKVEASTKGI